MTRTILITGASSGIGAAVVEEYVRAGHRVAALARRTDRLEELKTKLAGGPGEVLPIACDVLKDDDLNKAVEKIHTQWGPVDTVFANAGFGVVGPAAGLKIEDYERQFATNVYGVLRTLNATLFDLRETRGRFAVTGSVAGFISLPGGAAYSMSKFAIRAFCDALYFELKLTGIAVTHIAPGFVVSEIHKVDNLGAFHPHAKHHIPAWICVPTHKAAREIFRAIEGRKRERIVTGHGKILTWVYRHFPWAFRFIVGALALKARPSVQR
ncbi:MAG: SDR family NAD(P)-dependent oxidoreductase [Deltaproteobacteria bacterium]|nr:SDR family NAD(P)-dependent oxidoreductase [Deltaproteobacteria bacterium]